MKIQNIATVSIVAVGIASLSSCHIYNKFDMPTDTPLTSEYVQAKQAGIDSTSLGNIHWQDIFTDPQLASLINRALSQNTDLQNAKLNVDIANAQLNGARLSYLPSLTLAASGSKAYFDYAGMRNMPWTYQVPVQASWEIDIFGKLLNAKRRAKAQLLQSQAYEQAVRSQIIGGVANCYYSIAMIEKQLQISRQTSVYWKESVEIMKNFKLAGRVNETAVVQSTANYYSILASITDLEVSLHQANNTLARLLNTDQKDWNISPDALLTLPAEISQGIPMSQLAARPDVAAAEQSVAIAYYATNQARAAFYPGITISGTGGFTNSLATGVVNPANWFANLAGSLTAPLFARGQLISNLKAAKAQQEQSMNNFQHTLLNASAEVSEALVLYNKSNEKQLLLDEQVGNLEKAVEYTQELLALDGTSTYLEVITAQQSLLQAQLAQAACQNTMARAGISLYQSLGGGR
ncbi:efflux transporter outer membrane subunit [uncultured Muribaculum sp.]|uniref:efflux transporter outer membrane subunit n=1 Tax=uncultured Muribaculum sp. TaxID=1918613 RepID=UPI0025AFE8FA|nr:efflux transporter outer membrane subunit [uncultured Muribaculum sp.]